MTHVNSRKSSQRHKMTPIFTHPMEHFAPLGRLGMTEKGHRWFFVTHLHAITSPRSIIYFHDMRVYGRKLTCQPTVPGLLFGIGLLFGSEEYSPLAGKR